MNFISQSYVKAFKIDMYFRYNAAVFFFIEIFPDYKISSFLFDVIVYLEK